jgi:hypothetical protein
LGGAAGHGKRGVRRPGNLPSPWIGMIVLILTGGFSALPAVTPGEATDLVVTGYDPATGNIQLTYTPACSASNHHIEYGLIQDISTTSYSGQECAIGTSGAFNSFNPGAGSYYFMVVGDDATGIEGSYGTGFIGGTEAERLEDLLDPVCAFTQDLSQRCDGPFLPILDLTAFRPQSEFYGMPLQRTAVPDSDEFLPGAGIRINGDDDNSNGQPDSADVGVPGENDLIEVEVTLDPPAPPPGFEYVLTRTDPAIKAWTDPTKSSELFGGGNSFVVTLPSTTESLWIENPAGGTSDLALSAREISGGAIVASDQIHFYPFTGIVIALGGEGQVAGDPTLDPGNHGAFELAIVLYRGGYDVHMYDEDVVSSSGSGSAYNEVVSAVQSRAISGVAIYGYSHGGGSTNDLARRLNDNRGSIGIFNIAYTAYIDGIDNGSDIDIGTETALPPSTAYHASYYENPGCGFFALCGGPISGADLNLNVSSTPWGASLDHFSVDDAPEVLLGILDQLVIQLAP